MAEELQNEVTRLTGDRYIRKEHQSMCWKGFIQYPNRRWGNRQGSMYLADQKLLYRISIAEDQRFSILAYLFYVAFSGN